MLIRNQQVVGSNPTGGSNDIKDFFPQPFLQWSTVPDMDRSPGAKLWPEKTSGRLIRLQPYIRPLRNEACVIKHRPGPDGTPRTFALSILRPRTPLGTVRFEKVPVRPVSPSLFRSQLRNSWLGEVPGSDFLRAVRRGAASGLGGARRNTSPLWSTTSTSPGRFVGERHRRDIGPASQLETTAHTLRGSRRRSRLRIAAGAPWTNRVRR